MKIKITIAFFTLSLFLGACGNFEDVEPTPNPDCFEGCFMLSQGPLFPTGAGEGGGGGDWTNESNVFSSNNTYATAQRATNGVSTESIRAYGYGFNIPRNAIIRGIVVHSEIKASLDDATHNPYIRSIKPHKAADTTAAEGAPGSNPDQIQNITISDATYSAPISDTTYLWGQSWTPDEINSNSFGMFFHVAADGGGASLITFSVDVMSITVYYDLPGDFGTF